MKAMCILVFLFNLNNSYSMDSFDASAKRFVYFLEDQHLIENDAPSEILFKRLYLWLSQTILELQTIDQTKESEEKIEMLKNLQEYINQLNDPDKTDSAYMFSLRALGGIYEEMYKTILYNPFSVFRYLFLPKLRLPYMSPAQADLPIGQGANYESYPLYDSHRSMAISVNELGRLSSQQVGQLDVPPGHPSAYTLAEIKNPRSPWMELEKKFEFHVQHTKNLKELQTQYGPFTLDTAREVLFFEGISNSNTSPKFKVKDIYGQKWRLKLGPEAQTEPVMSKLYSMVGGKGFDLNYSHHFQHDKQIIFFPSAKAHQAADCMEIVNVTDLLKCLCEGRYKFRANSLIADHGVAELSNWEELRPYLSPSLYDSETFKKQVISRHWVVFKESSVEFVGKDKYNSRLGMVSASEMGATHDRAYRGMVMFHLWTQSRDAKNQNHRSSLVKTTENEWEYVEGFHDLGGALGNHLGELNINTLNTDDSFVHFSKNKKNLIYELKGPYRPDAWDFTTWADQLWMVNRILRIGPDDLSWAIQETHWPLPMQKVILSILRNRQKMLAKYYRMPMVFPNSTTSTLSMKIDWHDKEDREEVFLNYPQIRLEAISYLEDNPSYRWDEVISSKNKIRSCKQSLFVGLLEKYIYPSGLERRPNRFFSNGELKDCLP